MRTLSAYTECVSRRTFLGQKVDIFKFAGPHETRAENELQWLNVQLISVAVKPT